jgi:uncharacterized protein YwgA
MNANDFVLSLIDAFDGHVEGGSFLQRRAYFVSVLTGIDSAIGFATHYNGPYSFCVDTSVARLKSLGLLNQSDSKPSVTSSGLEIKRYEYRLTNEGVKAAAGVKQRQDYEDVANACQAILKAGNPDQLTLSIAAKAYCTLKKRGQEMSTSNIVREAQKYNSMINKTTLDAVVRFIGELKLGQRSNPN